MPNKAHRYRITVTPVGDDGLQCHGRCTMEFEHSSPDDWMRILEGMQQHRGLSGDEGAALTVGTQLLAGLMREHPDQARDNADRFARLRPHMAEFIRDLKRQ